MPLLSLLRAGCVCADTTAGSFLSDQSSSGISAGLLGTDGNWGHPLHPWQPWLPLLLVQTPAPVARTELIRKEQKSLPKMNTLNYHIKAGAGGSLASKRLGEKLPCVGPRATRDPKAAPSLLLGALTCFSRFFVHLSLSTAQLCWGPCSI